MTILRQNIRRLRGAADLTSTEASTRAGMSQGTWSDIERGKNANPTPKTLEKVAAALGVTLVELVHNFYLR